jgi:hypothetical protein
MGLRIHHHVAAKPEPSRREHGHAHEQTLALDSREPVRGHLLDGLGLEQSSAASLAPSHSATFRRTRGPVG